MKIILTHLTLIALILLNSNVTHADTNYSSDNINLQFTNPQTGNPQQIQIQTMDADNLEQAYGDIQSSIQNPKANVVISTDQVEFYQSKINALNTTAPVVLIPINAEPANSAESQSSKNFWSLAKQFPGKIYTANANTKIRLMIVTFSVLNESFIWIHTAGLSTYQITANIMFTIATSIAFGIDNKSWANTTKPIQRFFHTLFGMKQLPLLHTDPRDLAVRFASSFVLSTALYTSRTMIVYIDQVLTGTLALHQITMPLFASLLATVASFAWSEHVATIDGSKNKNAEFFFSRAQEMRGFVLGCFATTASLLNPTGFAVMPWATLIATGIIGITVYWNHEKVNDWIERRFKVSQIKSDFLDFISGANKNNLINSCQAIY